MNQPNDRLLQITDTSGNNSSVNHTNSSVDDTNSSFIANISSSVAQVVLSVKEYADLSVSFSDVTPVITHLFDFSDCRKQCFTSHDDKRYYSSTTKLIAVKPSRHSLAIFVPKTCLTTNQQATTGMNKNTSVFIQARHIFSAVTGANIYDGLIEPNTTAFTVNKLNRLVTVVKTRHPIFMGDNKLTKLLGGYHA